MSPSGFGGVHPATTNVGGLRHWPGAGSVQLDRRHGGDGVAVGRWLLPLELDPPVGPGTRHDLDHAEPEPRRRRHR